MRSVRDRSIRWKTALLLVSALLLCGLAWGLTTGFAASSSPSPDPAGERVLRIGWMTEPSTLNPLSAYLSPDYEILSLNFDYLATVSASDFTTVEKGEKAAGLAIDWSNSPDGTEWTFSLRPGMTWQDGEPVTSADVLWTYNTIIKQQIAAYMPMVEDISSVTAVDDLTVKIVCTKPKGDVSQFAAIPILPEHLWSKVKPEALESAGAVKLPVVGSGAFQTVEWKRGSHVRMVANKDYWRGAPKIDEIFFQVYKNEDTMVQDQKAGAIDACSTVPAVQVDSFRQEPDQSLAEFAGPNCFDCLVFNCYDGPSHAHPAVKDPDFRQALQWAIDRDKIAEITYNGHARPGDTFITRDYYPPERDWHWSPPEPYSYDLTKANELLDEAGYTDGDGDGIRESDGQPIELRVWSLTGVPQFESASKLITGWFKQCGLKIKLELLDVGALTDRLFNTEDGEYVPDGDIHIWGWSGFNSADFIAMIFTTKQINNWNDSNWSNEEYDSLYTAFMTELDWEARKAALDRMQELVYEESPYLVFAYPTDTQAYNTGKWTGWVRQPSTDMGGVILTTFADSYLFVEPKTAGGEDSGGASGTTWVIVGVVAAAVVAVATWLLLSRRRRSVDEVD